MKLPLASMLMEFTSADFFRASLTTFNTCRAVFSTLALVFTGILQSLDGEGIDVHASLNSILRSRTLSLYVVALYDWSECRGMVTRMTTLSRAQTQTTNSMLHVATFVNTDRENSTIPAPRSVERAMDSNLRISDGAYKAVTDKLKEKKQVEARLA